jgi:predicted nucleotidyltransferase
MSEPLPARDVQPALSALVRRIVEHARPERVVLFGSRASGRARPDSDVDLLVVVPDADDPRAVTVQLYRVLAGSGVGKDLVVVTAGDFARWKDVPGTVVRTADREGQVLYVRSA